MKIIRVGISADFLSLIEGYQRTIVRDFGADGRGVESTCARPIRLQEGTNRSGPSMNAIL